jgi:ornithine cyclodeaminase
VLVLTAADVEALLDRDALVDAMASALAELSAGTASIPPRTGASVADRGGLLAAMPGHLATAGVLGAKLVSVFPGNESVGVPSHQAVIVMFDSSTGTPTALLDGRVITAERTAATSALATRLLARPDAEVLAIIGTGVQARTHALHVPRVCTALRAIRIAGRNRERARALADEITLAWPDLDVRVTDSVADACDGAAVVCATTHSPDPVVQAKWLAPGTHVCSVGFSGEGREVGADTVAASSVFVESRASALAPAPAGANDLTWSIRDGQLAEADIVEIGELVLGVRPGRADAGQITLYKSVGVAAEDLAAAQILLAAAVRAGAGHTIDL